MDRLWGGTGRDRISGGRKGDHFYLAADGDTVIAGEHGLFDVARYRGNRLSATVGVLVDLGAGIGRPLGRGRSDRLRGVEDVYGTRFADILRGDYGGNSLDGGGGNDRIEALGGPYDVLYGRRGHDVLVGGSGQDEMLGGRGSDYLDGGPEDEGTIDGGPGRDRCVDREAYRC